MKLRTVALSLFFHAGLATFLMSRAETRQQRRAISVAVADAKKADKPKPPPPPPPKPIVHRPPPPKPVEEAKPEPVAPVVKELKVAPVETRLALSNADLAPGGIALAGTPKLEKKVEPAAKAVRVAQAIPDEVRRRLQAGENVAGVAEPECEEEPTKPEPVFQTEIEYTAAAREQGIEGKMKIKITVGADGSVSDVEVEAGLDPAFDAAALAAIKQWRFKPALKCGKPFAGGTFRIVRIFELAN